MRTPKEIQAAVDTLGAAATLIGDCPQRNDCLLPTLAALRWALGHSDALSAQGVLDSCNSNETVVALRDTVKKHMGL